MSRVNKLVFSATSRYCQRYSSTLVSNFEEMVQALPMREALRYKHKNMKWSAEDFKHFGDSHANGLIDLGFVAGDRIAIWHKESAEKHVTLWAAAKIGMLVIDIDPALSTVKEVRQALKVANCKALIFEPVTETQDNLLLLRKSIPEFFHYDDTYGDWFHSKYFPSMKYFIHTGFDIERGCLHHRSLFLPNPIFNFSDTTAAAVTDATPLYQVIVKGEVKDGEESPPDIVISEVFTQGDVFAKGVWEFADKMIQKKYLEI